MKSFIVKIAFLVNIIFALALGVSYLSVHIPPDKFWYPAFLGMAYPYLLLINILFVFFWLWYKPQRIWLSVLMFMLGINHFNDYYQLFPPKKFTGEGIKVLSYNVHHFTYDLNKKQSNSPELLEFLKAEAPDIICLQETRLLTKGKLSPASIRDVIPSIHYYQMAHTTTYAGPLTFSRYPIVNLGEIRFKHSYNMVLFSDIVLPKNDTVRVYNCHLQSNRILPDEYGVVDSLAAGNDPKLRETKLVLGKLKKAFIVRANQARILAAHIARSPYPVIVCGDFNDTPVSFTYRTVRGKLKDAFVESGFGTGNSYNGKLPSFRIDYILHSHLFEAHNFKRIKVGFSDHYPVTTVLTIRDITSTKGDKKSVVKSK